MDPMETPWSTTHGQVLLSHWRDATSHSFAHGMPYFMELMLISWEIKEFTHGNQRPITKTLPWLRVSHGIPSEHIFLWQYAVATLFLMGNGAFKSPAYFQKLLVNFGGFIRRETLLHFWMKRETFIPVFHFDKCTWWSEAGLKTSALMM